MGSVLECSAFIDHHVLRVHLHSVHRPAARPPEGCRRRAPPHRGDPGALTPHALHMHPGCSSLENLNHGALSTAISPHMHHPTHPSTHPASVRLSIGFHCAFGFGSEARAPVGCTGPRRAIRLTQHCHRAIGIRSVRRCGANLTGSHAPSRLSSRRRSPPRRRPLRRRVFSPSSRRTPLPPLPRRPPPSRLSSRRRYISIDALCRPPYRTMHCHMMTERVLYHAIAWLPRASRTRSSIRTPMWFIFD